MKKRLLLTFVLIPFLLSVNGCNFFGGYSQSYVLLMSGKEVGKLIVNEKTDRKGNLTCLSEQEMDAAGAQDKKRTIIRTKMVIQKGELFPVSYSLESSAGSSYDIKVENGQIIKTLKQEGASRESTTSLAPGMSMLNPAVFHTFDIWIRQYDLKKGGQQFFKTYLLPAGSVEQLSVFPLETGIIKHEGKDLQLRNYRIEFKEGLTLLVWVDNDSRLCRLAMQGANIDVIRSDLFEQLHAETAGEPQQKRP